MDIQALSKRYTVRKLDASVVDQIFELMRKNTTFYEYHPPFVTRESIMEDMKALPPGKDYEDKYYVGFFEEKSLIAVMDLILSYPAGDTAFIGFFMTDVKCQNRGVGSGIIHDACIALKAQGFQKVRLGVDRGNPQSFAFWTRNRFRVIAENDYILMELAL